MFLYQQVTITKKEEDAAKRNREMVTLKTCFIHFGADPALQDAILMKVQMPDGYRYVAGKLANLTVGSDGWVDTIHLSNGQKIDASKCEELIKLVPKKTKLTIKEKGGETLRKVPFIELREDEASGETYIGYKKKVRTVKIVEQEGYIVEYKKSWNRGELPFYILVDDIANLKDKTSKKDLPEKEEFLEIDKAVKRKWGDVR